MGSSLSKEQTLVYYGVEQFNSQEWSISQSILKRTSSTAKLQRVPQQCQPKSIYSSQKHSFLIDEYILDASEALNREEYLKQIKWRNSCEQLVNIKYIKGFNSTHICQSTLNSRYIYTEHIPLRLSQITDVPFPDNLYLLRTCLKGFQYIFQHFGWLNIREDLICLNSEGKIKVWINANHSKNNPHLQNIFKMPKKSEIALVNDIIEIVNQNTDHQFQPKQFKNFLREFNLINLTFLQCIQAVQHFAYLLKVSIPDSLQSVNGLFNPLLNKLNTHDLSYTYGRMIDTNQTKMVQSIPLQRQDRVNTEYINNSNYIHSVDQYACHSRMQNSNERNTDFHPIIKTQQTYFEQFPSQTLVQQNTSPIKPDDLEWRYFDMNGWVDIDEQILLDLKKISINF